MIGTIIFFLMMATAFLGYVLPYGQMSLWGGLVVNNIIFSLDLFICINFIIYKGDYKYKRMHSNYIYPKIEIEPTKEFMSMFLGLVDGDGYIEIGPQKQYAKKTKELRETSIRARLVIRLHKRDTELLEYLVKVLEVGSISQLHVVNQTRLIF